MLSVFCSHEVRSLKPGGNFVVQFTYKTSFYFDIGARDKFLNVGFKSVQEHTKSDGTYVVVGKKA